MKVGTRASLATVTAAAIGTLVLLTAASGIHFVSAMSSVKVSSNVSLLPKRSDVDVVDLAASDMRLKSSAAQALDTAKRQFTLQDAEVDSNIGVVSAIASIVGDPKHHNEAVWIVTADRTYHLLAPGRTNLATHKLCIVINGLTGQYEYAYTADERAY
jgi:hypothetical protein